MKTKFLYANKYYKVAIFMNENIVSLNQVPLGKRVKIKSLLSSGTIRRRLLDIGLIEGTIVESLHRSPLGDPIAYLIRGAVIALRCEDSSNILVEILV